MVYLQDPAGGEKTMKSMWTKDEMHKVEGQLRFHPGIQYKTVKRPGPAAAPDYERRAADPRTLAWLPSYEFAWSVSDSTVVKKAVTVKEGAHPIVVHAVLRSADRKKVGEVRRELTGKPADRAREDRGREADRVRHRRVHGGVVGHALGLRNARGHTALELQLRAVPDGVRPEPRSAALRLRTEPGPGVAEGSGRGPGVGATPRAPCGCSSGDWAAALDQVP